MAYYSWILAFHVMGFISWMAMLFYQPRLFVYHSENGDNEGFVKVVQRQEYILNKAIGTPAMWATILSGATMLYVNPAIFSSGGWMHTKLLFVAFLIGYHFSLEHLRKKLIENPHHKSGKWFRFYNEVPTLLMIFIVIMVVVKPF